MITSILEKYKKLPQQVKASLWFVVSNIMIQGMSFITLPIFSRLMSTEEYGTVSVYQSWLSIVSIITTLTIWGGVFNVGMVRYGERAYEMISAFQGMALSLTFLGFIITMIAFPYIQSILHLPKLLVICIYIEILVQIPFNLWASEQRYRFEYKKLILFTAIINILNPLLGYFAVVNATQKAEARIISALIIQALFGICLCIYNQKRGKKYFDADLWKWGFTFNVILIPHYLSMQILNQSDRIMISNMCGKSDAGIYSVAYSFAQLLLLFTSAINSSLTPHIYQCIKKGEEKKLKGQTTAVIITVAVLSIGLIAIIPDVFHLLLPESYYPALKCIPPITAGAFFLFLYPLFGSVEFYYEENKYVTYASITGAILNIALNYIFIRLFGFVAAAYTTLFCYICFSMCHYIFMRRIMKQKGNDKEIYDLKAIFLISIGVICLSILMVAVYDYPIARWLTILITISVGVWKRQDLLNIFRVIRQK